MDPLCANTRKKGVSGMTDVQNEKCSETTEQLQVGRELGGKASAAVALMGCKWVRITGRGCMGHRDISKQELRLQSRS